MATASVVRGWVLLEQPGPWGSEALIQSRLPDPVASELADRAQRDRVRVLLIRRPDRTETDGRHCFVVYSGRPTPWIEHRVIADPGELLGLDLSRLRLGERVGFGDPWTRPLHLVCTNGRHDPCCAQLGRPVIRALMGRRGAGAAWECSHVGGDRFAGNVVCMPHGLYFGRLGPDEAVRVVEGYENGQLELDHYRGRAGDPFAVQAAEFFVRQAEGLRGVDDLVPHRRHQAGPGVFDVTFTGSAGRTFSVRVAVTGAYPHRPLTCAAVSLERPAEYSLVSLRTD